MISVMMRVYNHINGSVCASRQSRKAKRRRVGKLRIDHGQRVSRREPADRAASSREKTNIAPQRLKFPFQRRRIRRPNRFRRSRCRWRSGLGKQLATSQPAKRRDTGCMQNKITAIDRVTLGKIRGIHKYTSDVFGKNVCTNSSTQHNDGRMPAL